MLWNDKQINFLKEYKLILAKFKCYFGGDLLPTLIWSHNESHISEIIAAVGAILSRYWTHKLHDIYYLDIGSVNLNDNGQIKCTIMNRFGRKETIAQLFVDPKEIEKNIDYRFILFFF